MTITITIMIVIIVAGIEEFEEKHNTSASVCSGPSSSHQLQESKTCEKSGFAGVQAMPR